MAEETFIASAGTWGNSKYPNGFRITREVQKRLFKRKWKSVILHIGQQPVSINLTDAFWVTCNELRSAEIKKWLVKRGLHKWTRGKPPKVRITHLGGNEFKLVGPAN